MTKLIWKSDQDTFPNQWNVKVQVENHYRPTWMCNIAFNENGLVGMDSKSHQEDTTYPYPAITRGNNEQDRNCYRARRLRTTEDILVPSGGPLVVMCKEGRMFTCAPNKFVRILLRQKSVTELNIKITQGKPSIMKDFMCRHTLDIRAFTACPVPPHLKRFRIAEDGADSTDLSNILFRQSAR